MSKKKTQGNGGLSQMKLKNRDLLRPYFKNRSIYDSPFVDRYKYNRMWQQYCLQQYITQHEWDLGDMFGITSNKIEFELYNKGWLLGYLYKGQPIITPAIPENLNLLGEAATFVGIDYMGNHLAENLIPNMTCVVLNSRVATHNNQLASSVAEMDAVICNDIAETFARLQVNLINSSVKIIAVSGDTNANELLRNEMRKVVSSDDAIAVIASQFDTANLTKSFAEIKFAEYIDLIENYERFRCKLTGQQAGAGMDKKERNTVSEVDADTKAQEIVNAYNLYIRQQFCDKFNELFGANISVRKQGDKDEIDDTQLSNVVV